MHKKSTARRKPAPRATPHTKPATPPPLGPRVIAAPADHESRLWHFCHTHPQIPGVVNVVVQAPDLMNARGAAYLLAEQFSQNVIGYLRAGDPAHDPRTR